MKRAWIGCFLLLLLLAVSLVVTWAMTQIHDPIEQDLNQAARCALAGEEANAAVFLRRAWEQWDRWSHLRSCFADHSPAEEIEADFAALSVYLESGELTAFAAAARSLARQAAAMGEAHQLVWWNVF